jgi:hypothetical protein
LFFKIAMVVIAVEPFKQSSRFCRAMSFDFGQCTIILKVAPSCERKG